MHFKSCVAALLVVGAGALTFAQTKVTTEEDLDKNMKKIGPALQAANKALASNAPSEAVKQLAIMREAVTESREFWVMHKKQDAQDANKLTVEKMLAGASPDVPAVQAALKQEVGGACRQCHEKYRARDAENNWVLKPGSI